MKYVMIRNDDPCALFDDAKERKILEVFAKYHIPQVFGVIPKVVDDPHNADSTEYHRLEENPKIIELIKEYRSKGLVEIAQHGFVHQTNRFHPSFSGCPKELEHFPGIDRKWLPYSPVSPEGYSEFNKLPYDEIKKRVLEGKAYIEKIFNVRPETFIYPWNSYDKNSLKAVVDCGFKYVLCGADLHQIPSSNLIVAIKECEENFLTIDAFIKALDEKPQPAFVQAYYHSWMLSESQIERLDRMLQTMSGFKSIRFTAPVELGAEQKNMSFLIRLNNVARILYKEINRSFEEKLSEPKAYELTLGACVQNIIKPFLALVFCKLTRLTTICITMLLLISFDVLDLVKGHNRVYQLLLKILLSLLLVELVMRLVFLFKRWCGQFTKVFQPGGGDDFEKIELAAKKYFQDPETCKKYFSRYKRRNGHTVKEKEHYFQIQYFHVKDKWIPLNRLGELFAENGKCSLAHMCFAESLRVNPAQDSIFEAMQAIESKVSYRFPEQLEPDVCKVSVIMPTYSRLDIRTSIESVLSQTFEDYELIIINDGGSEKVREVVESYRSPKIKYFRLEQNKGVSTATNEALLKARGKYIAYLDDDDVYYPDHLRLMVGFLEEYKCKLAYSNTQIVEVFPLMKDYPYRGFRRRAVWDEEFHKDKLISKIFISTLSVVHERSVFEKVGLFNQDMDMSQDWEFWLRCAELFEFGHVSQNTGEYRTGVDNSIVRRRVSSWFFGILNRGYFGYMRGSFAYLKYFLHKNDKSKADDLYQSLKSRYRDSYKSNEILKEFQSIARQFGDSEFLTRIRTDYPVKV